jgi:hypothetical protein
MVALATKHGLFGGTCTLDRVGKEMQGWNDYNLHTFARECTGLASAQMTWDGTCVGWDDVTLGEVGSRRKQG